MTLRFDDTLPMQLYRTLDAVMPAYRALFSAHDLTEPQWRVLRVVWDERSASQAELSRRTLISPPSLVALLDRLETKGLVARMRSVEDRRSVHVVATPAGRELHAAVADKVDAITSEIRDRLTDAEWQTFATLLGRIVTPAEMNERREVATS